MLEQFIMDVLKGQCVSYDRSFSFKQSKNKLTSSTKRGETHCFIMSKAYVWPGPSCLITPLCTARSDGLIVVSAGT